jgi:hypothetical protein
MTSLRANHSRNNYIFAILALINSTWIFYTYLSFSSIGLFRPAALSKVLEGTAERPYVYRILLPLLARLFSPTIPSRVAEWFASAPPALNVVFDRLSGGMYPREAAFIIAAMFLSLIGFVYTEKIFLGELGFPEKEKLTWPLFIQLFILPVNMFTGYYYDLPQLFLMTLSLLLMYRGDWNIYLVVLALASLNKETSLFLVVVFVIYFWPRLDHHDFFKLLIIQLLVYGVIRVLLLYTFQNNPGAPILFTTPAQFDKYRDYPYAFVFTLLYFSIVAYLILRRWGRKHEFLRAASIIGLMILVLFFISGTVMEFRIFLDALPALGILIFTPPSPSM